MSKAKPGPSDLWKKTFLMGLGATALTIEKLQGTIDAWVKQGDLPVQEAQKLTKALMNDAEALKADWEGRIRVMADAAVKSAIKQAGLVTREEFEALKASVARASAKPSAVPYRGSTGGKKYPSKSGGSGARKSNSGGADKPARPARAGSSTGRTPRASASSSSSSYGSSGSSSRTGATRSVSGKSGAKGKSPRR